MSPFTRCPLQTKKTVWARALIWLLMGWLGAEASAVAQAPFAVGPPVSVPWPLFVASQSQPAEPPEQPLPSPDAAVPLPPVFESIPPGEEVTGMWPDGGMDVIPLDFEDCANCSNCGCSYPPCESETRLGRFFCGIYHSICCPDPCYEPKWLALADAAFFTEAARPVTQTRFRWDAGLKMVLPDRAEYFWARSGGGGKGPALIEPQLTYNELSHYTEVAHGRFGVFTEVPYRSIDADLNPHAAGFGDIVAGTKSMLLDSALIQLTFQMKFITPVGVPSKGLGTGHLSLEPSLLLGLNLSPVSYLQAQLAEWVPIAGDGAYAGALLHYHLSYNRTLSGHPKGLHVIGTAEFNGWSFQDGAYSDPAIGQFNQASDETYASMGFGIRAVLCEKIDLGIGSAYAITSDHWAEQLYRTELRVRF